MRWSQGLKMALTTLESALVDSQDPTDGSQTLGEPPPDDMDLELCLTLFDAFQAAVHHLAKEIE